MKYLLLFISLLNINAVQGQRDGDSKIKARLSDTTNLYNRVKLSLIKNGYTVKDDMNTTVLTTNVAVKPGLGYTVLKAKIVNDTVIVSGVYSNKNKNLYSIEVAPGKYKKIIYFKNSLGWPILYSVASKLDPVSLTSSH